MELWLSSVCTLLGIHCVIFPFSCCVCVLVWLMSIRVCTAVNLWLFTCTCLVLLVPCGYLPCVIYLVGVFCGSLLHSAMSVLNSLLICCLALLVLCYLPGWSLGVIFSP